MDLKQTPDSGEDRLGGRPRLLFVVLFLSFFLGIQSLMSALPGLVFLGFSRDAEPLNRLVETTALSPALLGVLFVYQLFFGVIVLGAAYFLLAQAREGARRVLGAVFAMDVFLFLGITLYYRHIQFQPPSAELFYYDAFCTLMEIGLVVCLSHSSIISLTQARPASDSREQPRTDEQGQGPC